MILHQFTNPDSSSVVRFYHQYGFNAPGQGVVFVFGSNLRGRHGAGAAKAALERYGAIEGQGVGLQGQSYAIPTKDYRIQTMPLEVIEPYIKEFVQFTHDHPDMTFMVTPIGTGLAGYRHEDIAPLFKGVINCWLPLAWLSFWTPIDSKTL